MAEYDLSGFANLPAEPKQAGISGPQKYDLSGFANLPAESGADKSVSLLSASFGNPSEEAERRRLSADLERILSFPQPVVDIQEATRRHQALQADHVTRASPRTSEFLSVPDNAAVAIQDAKTLAQIEAIIGGDPVRSFEIFGKRAAMSAGNLGAWVGFDLPAVATDIVGESIAGMGVPSNYNIFQAASTAARKQAVATRSAIDYFTPEARNIVERASASAGTSVGTALQLMPLAAGTPQGAGMAAAFGLGTFGESYTKAREAGKNPVEALQYAIPQGAYESLFELAPAAFLANAIKTAPPLKEFVLGLMGREIPTELGTQLSQNLNDWITFDRPKGKTFEDFLNEQPESLAETAIATIIGAGAQAGMIHGAQRVTRQYQQMQEAREAQQAQDVLKQLFEQASAIKSDPVTFQSFMAGVSDNATVFIQSEELANALAQSGMETTAIPSLADQLGKASVTGDVEIPVGELLTAFANTPAKDQIVQHVRTNQEDLSAAQLKELPALQAGLIQMEKQARHEVEHRTEIRDIETEILGELQSLPPLKERPFNKNDLKAQARVMGAFYSVAADLYGVSPKQIRNGWISADGVRHPGWKPKIKNGGEVQGLSQEPGSANLKPVDVESPAFREWFGDSKVVDGDGKPLRVYHGTQRAKDGIDKFGGGVQYQEQIGVERGADVYWFTSSVGEADSYANWIGGSDGTIYGNPTIYPVYVAIKNPASIADLDAITNEPIEIAFYDNKVIDALIAKGFDGFVASKREMYLDYDAAADADDKVVVAFRNTQIKSAISNTGAFDPNDPSILRQPSQTSQRGSFNPSTYDLRILANADRSTFLHESSHFFMAAYIDMARQPDAPVELKEFVNGLLGYLFEKVHGGAQGGGDLAQRGNVNVPREESQAKSIKRNMLQYPDMSFPLTMPQEMRDEILRWNVVSQSPYSESFYDITNKSWDNDPDTFMRVADHWAFESSGRIHAQTNIPVEMGNWTLAEHGPDGIYRVIKSVPRLDTGSVQFNENLERRKFDYTRYERDAADRKRRIRKAVDDAVGVDIAEDPASPLTGRGYQRHEISDVKRKELIGLLYPKHIGEVAINRRGTRATIVSPEVFSIPMDRLEAGYAALQQAREINPLFQGGVDNAAPHTADTIETDGANILKQGEDQGEVGPLPEGATNIDRWNAMTIDQQRAYWEFFAEGFEQYAMTGKAPTKALQTAFSAFAKWLKKIYSTLKNFVATHGTKPLDAELTQYFDRMLATEAELEFARGKRGFQAFFKTLAESGMSPQQFADYLALDGLQKTEADEALLSRSIRDMKWLSNAKSRAIKALQDEAKDVRAEMTAEVSKEVWARPVYQAWQWLTAKEYDAHYQDEIAQEQWKKDRKAEADRVRSDTEAEAWAESDNGKKKYRSTEAREKARKLFVDSMSDAIDAMVVERMQAWDAEHPQPLPGEPKQTKRKSNPDVVDETIDSLFVAIAKLGGLNKLEVVEKWGLDPKTKINSGVFGKPVLRADGGKTIDEMRLLLSEEYGYWVRDDTQVDPFEGLFNDELSGSKVYSLNADYDYLQRNGDISNEEFLRRTGGRLDPEYVSAPDRARLTQLRMTKVGGVNPDMIADRFGFKSGDEMTHAIAQARPPREEISALVDERMLSEHGDLATPEAIEAAADEAIHNEAHLRMVVTEFWAIGKRNGSVAALNRAVKEYAANLIGKVIVKELRPDQYASAATRAGKAAERAFNQVKDPERAEKAAYETELKKQKEAGANDDIADDEAKKAGAEARKAAQAKVDARQGKTHQEIAAEEKRRQMLNTAAAKEAYAVKAEIRSMILKLRKIASYSDSSSSVKSREMAVVQAVRGILSGFDIGGESKGKKAAAYLDTVRQYDPTLGMLLQGVVEKTAENEKPWDELTVAEFRDLHAQVVGIWTVASEMKSAELGGQRMTLEDAQAKLLEQMSHRKKSGRKSKAFSLTDAEIRGQDFMSMAAKLVRPAAWIAVMDGEDNGQFRKLLWNTIDRASVAYTEEKLAKLKQFKVLLDTVAKDMKDVKIAAPELGGTFGEGSVIGYSELLHAVLHTGNLSNKTKLLVGRGWGRLNDDGTLDSSKWDAFMKRAFADGIITKTHMDFVQGVWDLMESMKEGAQKANREATGRFFEEIKATPIDTPFGVYRGGYVPAIVDRRQVADAANRDALEDMQKDVMQTFEKPGNGFTKSRVAGYNQTLELNIAALNRHIDQVLLFTHMTGPVRNVQRVLKMKDLNDAINADNRSAIPNIVRPWLHGAATHQVTDRGSMSLDNLRMFTTARGRTGAALMIANVLNAMQQITGFFPSLLKVNKRELAFVMGKYWYKPRELTASVVEKSHYMRQRFESEVHAMMEIIDDILLNPTMYEKAREWGLQHSYFLQTAVDSVMSPIIWQARYNEAITAHESEADAISMADDAVRETQGSNRPIDVAAYERGSPFYRMFMQFSGYFNTQVNTVGVSLVRASLIERTPARYRRIGVILFLGWLAPAIVGQIIMQLFRGGVDDDDKDGEWVDDWFMQTFIGAPIKYAAAAVPVLGSGVVAMFNAFNDKPYDDRVMAPAAISVLEGGIRGGKKAIAAMDDPSKTGGAIRDLGSLLAIFTGVPITPVTKAAGYITDVETGKVRPTGPVDYGRGVITGVASPESKR